MSFYKTRDIPPGQQGADTDVGSMSLYNGPGGQLMGEALAPRSRDTGPPSVPRQEPDTTPMMLHDVTRQLSDENTSLRKCVNLVLDRCDLNTASILVAAMSANDTKLRGFLTGKHEANCGNTSCYTTTHCHILTENQTYQIVSVVLERNHTVILKQAY